MDLQQILAAILNPNGQQQNQLAMAGAPTQVGDHNNPALLAGQMAQFAPQQAAQAPQQAVASPQAPQGQPMPQGAPMPAAAPPMPASSPPGGGIGGFLSNLIQGPQAAQKNQTIAWLKQQGMDDGTATMFASSKPALQQYLLQRSQGQKPIEVNGKLVDPSTMQVMADFSTPKSRNTTTINGKLVDADTGKVIGDYGQENKPPASYQEYQLAKQDGFKGTYTDWQTKSIREQDPTFSREKDLRQEYEMTPIVKNYQIVRDNYERIRQGAQQTTGAGDLAIVFGYMKMLDPTSVVRENEQASAENTAGVPAAIRNTYNRIMSGEKLSAEARQQMLAAAQQIYTESSKNLGDLNKRYGGIASTYQLDPSRIIQPPEQYDPIPPSQNLQPGALPLPPTDGGGTAPLAAPPVAAPSPAEPSPQRFGDPTQGIVDWQDWFNKKGR